MNEWKIRLLRMKKQDETQRTRLETNMKSEKPRRHLPYSPIFNNATTTDTNNDNDVRELEILKKKQNELRR